MISRPERYTREHALWLAEFLPALGDYGKEAADLLRHWPGKTQSEIIREEIDARDQANGMEAMYGYDN